MGWRTSNVLPFFDFIPVKIILENTSESKESGYYTLTMKRHTNTDGLKVLVGGQPLSTALAFISFPFGGTKVVVEVFRGPNMYDYSLHPITLVWSPTCPDSKSATLNLKPQFLKPCAQVEFHHSNKTFAVGPTS